MPAKTPFKRTLFAVLRITVMVTPFVLVFSRSRPVQFWGAARGVEWWVAPVFAVLTLIVMILQGLRWHMLLTPFVSGVPLRKSLAVYFASSFYSIALPTSAAQDVVRAVIMARQTQSGPAWASTWVARLLGLGVLGLLAAFGYVFLPLGDLRRLVAVPVYTAMVGLVAAVFLSFSKRLTRLLRAPLRAIAPRRISDALEDIRESVFVYRRHRSTLALGLLLTVATQLVVVANAAVLIYGISGTFPFVPCTVLVPLIEIVCMMLPLTPSSVGVRDALVLYLYPLMGLSQEQIAVYMLFVLFGLTLRLVGAVPAMRLGLNPTQIRQEGTRADP